MPAAGAVIAAVCRCCCSAAAVSSLFHIESLKGVPLLKDKGILIECLPQGGIEVLLVFVYNEFAETDVVSGRGVDGGGGGPGHRLES